MLGAPAGHVRAAIDELLAAGHLERKGVRLVPDAASHPTPGVVVASVRGDAGPVEVDYAGDGKRTRE